MSSRKRTEQRNVPASCLFELAAYDGRFTSRHGPGIALPSACRMAGVEGLEPPTPGFGDRCSSQLSYTPPEAKAAAKKARGPAARLLLQKAGGQCKPGTPYFAGLLPRRLRHDRRSVGQNLG